MIYFYQITVGIVRTLLSVLNFAMLARALLSWFPVDEDNRLAVLLYYITEPLIHPVRNFLERFDTFRNSPIDFSFLITSTLLIMVTMFI